MVLLDIWAAVDHRINRVLSGEHQRRNIAVSTLLALRLRLRLSATIFSPFLFGNAFRCAVGSVITARAPPPTCPPIAFCRYSITLCLV